MKKVLKIGLILVTIVTGANAALPVHPLTSAFKSTDNGGIKSAIDAYKDGIGAEIVDNPGVATDNSAMNTLVYKYGEAAKINNTTMLDQVINGNSNPTSGDLALAGKLGLDGAACNDGNINTSGETYLNGVCQGGVVGIVASNGLIYDNCEGGSRTWANAGTYCASKGMRLPTLGETKAQGGVIISCPTDSLYTWTSTLISIYYYDWSGLSISYANNNYSGMVRCVK